MSRNRFQLIQRYLHFNDNNAAGTKEYRLYKIRTILDIVVNNFRKNYPPGRLDGKLKHHKLVHIPHTKFRKYQQENFEGICEKISRMKLYFSVLSVVFLCIQKAATYDVTR